MTPNECLLRYPLFSLLKPRQFYAWLSGASELAFATGEMVHKEASVGTWLYLVLEGRVRVVRRSRRKKEINLGTIDPGEVFGDYALLPPHLSTSTCRAASPTRLLRLQLLPLMPVFAAMPGVGPNLKNWLRLHGLLAYLRGQCFFGFMSAPSALKFLDLLQPIEFHASRTLQADGLATDRWFVIESGEVLLRATSESGVETTRRLGPGDCFGERALIGLRDLSVAISKTPTRCLYLTKEAFTQGGQQIEHSVQQSLQAQPSSIQHRYVWLGQHEEADCGATALAMVARFLGLPISRADVRNQVSMGCRGASLTDLQRAAVAIGLRCTGGRVDVENFDQLSLPVILHQESGHYVVLYERAPNHLVIADPATGILRIGRDALRETFSGNVLLVELRGHE